MRWRTQILVIGSGIAGLSFSLKASKYARVLLITKKETAESNTNYAQGGIASVMSPDDDYGLHINDTIECGAGLCHPEAVKQIVVEGPRLVRELIDIGVEFSMHDKSFDLGREGGHSRNRIVHAKDLTGKEIESALLRSVSRNKNIKILDHHASLELITEHHLKNRKYPSSSTKDRFKFGINSAAAGPVNCFGAYVFDEKSKRIITVISDVTVICSGGIGQVYLHTTNPEIATGDGIAMAFRSGCLIGNMEFVQFHPTTLYHEHYGKGPQAFLISEALRGAGAILRTQSGRKFMKQYDRRESLAPRDIVARAIDSEMKKTGDEFVFLDITHVDSNKVKRKFPNIYRKCLEYGVDITRDYIPVVPAAHYICGGIVSDLNGRTSVGRLYALGESAMTGVHGANRLASNSLLEALVFAEKASKDCRRYFVKKSIHKKHAGDVVPDWDDTGTVNAEEWILISQNRTEIKQIMSNYVGIVRSKYRLDRALRRISLIKKEIEAYYKKTKISVELIELRNMALISYMIVKSALLRKESRGLHYRTDYPAPAKNYLNDTLIKNTTI